MNEMQMDDDRAKKIRETWERGRLEAEKYIRQNGIAVLYFVETPPLKLSDPIQENAVTVHALQYILRGRHIECEGIVVETVDSQ